MGWVFMGAIACVLLVWYLYQRSQNETTEDTAPQPDEAVTEDEDLLLTGIVLSEIYDDDGDSSDNVDSDEYDDALDDGYEDGGTLE